MKTLNFPLWGHRRFNETIITFLLMSELNVRRTKGIITTGLILFLLFSCSINDDPGDDQLVLPPITQTGENTFGCYINGKLLVPRDGTGTYLGADKGASFLGGYPDGAYNELDIRDYKSERTANILIHIQDLRQIGEGDYIIDESNGMNSIDGLDHNYIHCRVFDEATNRYQYYRSFGNSGVIKITRYDLPNRIVSGTFSCTVMNSGDSNDIIEITEGRFDFKWSTLPNKDFN